jgi:hypothetical protein
LEDIDGDGGISGQDFGGDGMGKFLEYGERFSGWLIFF